MTQSTDLPEGWIAHDGMAKPTELLDAIGELALQIRPHYMDRDQRERIAKAIGMLIDHVLAYKPEQPQ